LQVFVQNNSWEQLQVMETFGERLKTIRGSQSREAFASAFNVHPNTLARWEKNERSPDVAFVQRIAKDKGVNPNWLLLGEGVAYDSERVKNEPARAGTMRCGDPLGRVVVKEKVGDALQAAPGLDGLLQENQALRQECGELRAENRELRRENKALVNENAELRIEVQALKLRPDREKSPKEEPARKSA